MAKDRCISRQITSADLFMYFKKVNKSADVIWRDMHLSSDRPRATTNENAHRIQVIVKALGIILNSEV